MPFQAACPQCGHGYRIKDELSGKKGKCETCGEAFVLEPSEEEVTSGGSTVYRHVARQEEDLEPAHGDVELIEAVSDHFEKHVGPIAWVFHEILSDKIHVDIHVIEPTKERAYWVLFTTGMAELPMTPPEGAEDYEYSELMLCLPAGWPIKQEGPDEELAYWPIRWLKMLARLPYDYDTWLCHGHTIPNGDPPEPFEANTNCCCWLLLNQPWFDEQLDQIVLPDGRKIDIWTPIPLHPEEVKIKLDRGTDALLEHFEKARLPFDQLFDPSRPNTIKRKRWFGIW